MNIVSQPESGQPNKIKNCRSTYKLSADHGLSIWHALKEVIRVGALGLTPICAEYGLETRISPTERLHVLALDLHPTCVEKVHENLLGTKEDIRVFALDIKSIFT